MRISYWISNKNEDGGGGKHIIKKKIVNENFFSRPPPPTSEKVKHPKQVSWLRTLLRIDSSATEHEKTFLKNHFCKNFFKNVKKIKLKKNAAYEIIGGRRGGGVDLDIHNFYLVHKISRSFYINIVYMSYVKNFSHY